MRHPYKLRTVVTRFIGRNEVPHVLLDCGHMKIDPVGIYGNETAYQISQVSRAITGKPQRVRCTDCGAGEPPVTIARLEQKKKAAQDHADRLRVTGFSEDSIAEYLARHIEDADIRIVVLETHTQ